MALELRFPDFCLFGGFWFWYRKIFGLEAPGWGHQILFHVEPDWIRMSLGNSHKASSSGTCGDVLTSIIRGSQPHFLPQHMPADMLMCLISLDIFRFSQALNGSFGKVRCWRIFRELGLPLKVPYRQGCDFQVNPGHTCFSSTWGKPIRMKIRESHGSLQREKNHL